MKPKINITYPKLKSWIILFILTTGIIGLMYVSLQQTLRSEANDPQIEMAEVAAEKLAQGQSETIVLDRNTVNLEKSLSTFTMVYDKDGNEIVSNAKLNNDKITVPFGVLDAAKSSGENKVTWQPQRGSRFAIVVKYYNDKKEGYVVVGRSLANVEARESNLLLYAFSAWLGINLLTAAVIFVLPDNYSRNKNK